MKDYYKVLEISESASQEEIKVAFRKLAFKYHPDKNPGHEKESGFKFKEINEAYAVLGDVDKRRQYDLSGKGALGAGFGGYNQTDIFRDSFANQAAFTDLASMFRQAGLRFDDDFLNSTFFNGQNVVFHAYASSGSTNAQKPNPEAAIPPITFGSGIGGKAARFAMKKLFGIDMPAPAKNLDAEKEIRLKAKEATAGLEKEVKVKRDGTIKKLMVKIPVGIQSGTRIRLKGMGKREGDKTGDLYVTVRVF